MCAENEEIRKTQDQLEKEQKMEQYIQRINEKIGLDIIEGTGNGHVDLPYSGMDSKMCEAFEKTFRERKDLAEGYVHTVLREYNMDCKQIDMEQKTPEQRINRDYPGLQLKGMYSTRCPMETEQNRRKHEFVKKFMEAYSRVETEKMYNYRQENEEEQANLVVKAIKDGTIDLTNIKDTKFVQLLKAADNISLTTGRDMLREFSNIPEVNKRLLEYRDNKTIEYLEGKPQNPKPFPKTPMEQEKEDANEELARVGNLSQLFVNDKKSVTREAKKGEITFRQIESIKSLSIKRIAARQLGYVVGKIKTRPSDSKRFDAKFTISDQPLKDKDTDRGTAQEIIPTIEQQKQTRHKEDKRKTLLEIMKEKQKIQEERERLEEQTRNRQSHRKENTQEQHRQ